MDIWFWICIQVCNGSGVYKNKQGLVHQTWIRIQNQMSTFPSLRNMAFNPFISDRRTTNQQQWKTYNLRPLSHNLTLTCKSTFYDNRNFITRMLFKESYWHFFVLSEHWRYLLLVFYLYCIAVCHCIINQHDDDDDEFLCERYGMCRQDLLNGSINKIVDRHVGRDTDPLSLIHAQLVYKLYRKKTAYSVSKVI